MKNSKAGLTSLQLYRDGLISDPAQDPEAYTVYKQEKEEILNWLSAARVIYIVSGKIPEMPECAKWYTKEQLVKIITEAFGNESVTINLVR